MHSNKYLYKIHSVHDRLYKPCAFGASYSHPLEGFLIDCVSVMIAETVIKLSVRQSTLLYTFSSMKAVDDHRGYNFPVTYSKCSVVIMLIFMTFTIKFLIRISQYVAPY